MTKKINKRENSEGHERHLLSYGLNICFSRSFVLRRCCVLTWVTYILMRDILIFTQVAFGLRAPGSPTLEINESCETHQQPTPFLER